MKKKKPKFIGEEAMFKRRLGAGITCAFGSLVFVVWAVVANLPMLIMPAFLLLMAGWIIIQVAADTGNYSGNPKVREWAGRIKNP